MCPAKFASTGIFTTPDDEREVFGVGRERGQSAKSGLQRRERKVARRIGEGNLARQV